MLTRQGFLKVQWHQVHSTAVQHEALLYKHRRPNKKKPDIEHFFEATYKLQRLQFVFRSEPKIPDQLTPRCTQITFSFNKIKLDIDNRKSLWVQNSKWSWKKVFKGCQTFVTYDIFRTKLQLERTNYLKFARHASSSNFQKKKNRFKSIKMFINLSFFKQTTMRRIKAWHTL